MQAPNNQTLVAVTQLVQFVVVVAAIVVLASEHVLTQQVTGTLAGVGLAHSGIIGYNGATKLLGKDGT